MNHLAHIACRWTLALIALFAAAYTIPAYSIPALSATDDAASNALSATADAAAPTALSAADATAAPTALSADAAAVDYSGTTPRVGDVNIDLNSFDHVSITFPEASADNIFTVPEGLRFTDPLGNSVAINTTFGFTLWAGANELHINFPEQLLLGTYTLTIPADAITFASGSKNKTITLQWRLKGTKFQFGYYNSYETLRSFDRFALSAPEGVTLASTTLTQLRQYVGYDPDTYDPIFDMVPVDVTLIGNTALFTFPQPFDTKAGISLTIPAGTITAADGRTNREISIYQEVDPTDYIDVVACSPASHRYDLYGPVDHLVLNLDRTIDNDDILHCGNTIAVNGRNVPVTAHVVADMLVINIDKDCVRYDDYNQFRIPEGFLTTRHSCATREVWMNNVYLKTDTTLLTFLGVQPGHDAQLVTTPRAEVEKMGIVILQFDEPIDATYNADLSAVTVYDPEGHPCTLYSGSGWLAYDPEAETNAHTFTLWVYPDRTDVGTYTIHVPAGTFEGLESGTTNTDIIFPLVIPDIDTFRPITSIADGATVNTLSELVLTAPQGITFDHFTDYPANFFYLTGEGINGDGRIINQATIAPDGKTATLRLGSITTDGDYTITIPKGYLRSTDPSKGNAEITLHVTLSQQTLPWDADGNGEINAADVLAAAAVVLEHTSPTAPDTTTALRALDLNGDGHITIGEIARLIQRIKTGARPPRPQ